MMLVFNLIYQKIVIFSKMAQQKLCGTTPLHLNTKWMYVLYLQKRENLFCSIMLAVKYFLTILILSEILPRFASMFLSDRVIYQTGLCWFFLLERFLFKIMRNQWKEGLSVLCLIHSHCCFCFFSYNSMKDQQCFNASK